jgi:hypothetical protein
MIVQCPLYGSLSLFYFSEEDVMIVMSIRVFSVFGSVYL